MRLFRKIFVSMMLLMMCSCCLSAVSEEDIRKIDAAIPKKATKKPARPRTVLVFSLCKGFRHGSIPYWNKALVMMGEKTGAFKATVSDDMEMLKPENLHKFDALVLNNTTRLKIDDPVIRKSILDFIMGGKGIMGIHAATDNFYTWPQMQEIMGGKFIGHPWGSGSTVAVKIDDPDHPLMKAFKGQGFKIKDEIYLTRPPLYSRKKARVLMSLDMSDDRTAGVKGGKYKNDDVGLTWIKSVGKGRLFYGSLGHNPHITWTPAIIRHYLDGLQFVLGDYPVDTTPVPLPQGVPPAVLDMEKLDGLLDEIAKYDYGRSREVLTQLSDFIRGLEGTENLKAVEKKFIEFLQSDATLAGKQFICRNLSIMGTEASAEVLARMLIDPKTADMARYALEQIPGEGVDEVLRKTLPLTKGVEKVGIISTLGLRADAESVPLLAELIGDSDSDVAAAAVAALGQIGTPQARAALAAARDTTTGDLQLLVLDAYLSCADRLIDEGKNDEALKIYRELYTGNIPQQIRSAALRGTVYSLPEKAGRIILEVIKSGHAGMQEVAFGLVGEVRDDTEIKAIADQLAGLSATGQVQLITALANRGSPVAKDAVVAAVGSDNADVRIAALKALASLGDASTVELLADAAANAVGAERLAARESLYSISDPEADRKILELIPRAPEPARVELIRSISRRNIKGALQTLLKTVTDSSARVQIESCKALKTVAGADQLDRLVELLCATEDSAVRGEMERTVAAIAAGIEDPCRKTAALIAAFESADDTAIKTSLLMVLGRIGEDNSFLAVYMGLKDPDATVREAAIKALSGWPNSKPADALLEIARNASGTRERILALRGYVKLAGLDAKTRPDRTVARFRRAMTLASGVSEKRLVLAGIGNVRQEAALDLAVEYIQDAELAPEAQAAVVRIAAAIAQSSPQAAKTALAKVIAVSGNEMIRRQAQTVVDQID